jgi:HEAT repeat protein
MDFQVLMNDKSIKSKEKTELLSKWLLNNPDKQAELIEFAKASKDTVKATCIEAFEYATKIRPEMADIVCLEFVTKSLTDKAPRVRWESAKVTGNIAHLFPRNLDAAIINLIINTEHKGTVVRWSAAFALGQIIKIKTRHNKELIPSIETICKREEKNSIRKIYLDALKKVNS